MAAAVVVLLTGVRIWPVEGVGPWSDFVMLAAPGDDPIPMLLHVAGAVALLVLVALVPRARWATALVALTLVSGYLVARNGGDGGWFAYTPSRSHARLVPSNLDGDRWAVVHALVLAPIAASAVGFALGRRRGVEPVEEPPGADDLGAG